MAQQPPTDLVPMGGQALAAPAQFNIEHGPSFAMLRVALAPNQTLIAEAGSMVARDVQVAMDVKMNAGRNPGFFGKLKAIMIAFLRKAVGGESFFVNHFSSPQGGNVWVAPGLSGQISHRRLGPGETLTLSSGAFVASMGDIDLKMKFGGLKTLFAKEGAFMLQASGPGEIWFNSYGGVHPIDVNGSFIVDNGHIVGFEGNLAMNIKSAGGGLMGLMASGEGLVCEFIGQGRVYIQSRNTSSLVAWLSPNLR